MIRTAVAAALVLSLAAPAMASAGKENRAKSLGVDANDFTMNELIRLSNAQREGDTNTVNFILSQAGNEVVSTQSGISAGHAHRAATLGVDPQDYSMNDLVRLSVAQREGDSTTVNLILSQAGGEVVSTQSGVSAGKAHRAASLGVNPNDYTMNELILLNNAIKEGETSTVNLLMSRGM